MRIVCGQGRTPQAGSEVGLPPARAVGPLVQAGPRNSESRRQRLSASSPVDRRATRLWFGPNVPSNKELYSSPRGVAKPQTPDQLRDLLTAGSNAVRDGLVKVVVLDLTRS